MNRRKKRPHEVRLPRRKPQLKRQYSSNTSQILYKQIVAAEKKKQQFDLFFCTQTLKNGKPCMCKEFDITTHLCKRHYNLKNKELNKNT